MSSLEREESYLSYDDPVGHVDLEGRAAEGISEATVTFMAAVALDEAEKTGGGEIRGYFVPPSIEHLTLEVLQEWHRDRNLSESTCFLSNAEEIKLVLVVQESRNSFEAEDVERHKKRAALAESVLAASYLPRINSYVGRRIGPQARRASGLDGVIAECEIALIEQIRSVNLHDKRPGFSFANWMFGIMRHKLTDGYRSVGRDDPVDLYDANEMSSILQLAGDNDTAEAAVAIVGDPHLAAAFASLGERDRRILEMRLVYGVPREDVGQAMELSSGSVGVAQHRATRKLRMAYMHEREKVSTPATQLHRKRAIPRAQSASSPEDPNPLSAEDALEEKVEIIQQSAPSLHVPTWRQVDARDAGEPGSHMLEIVDDACVRLVSYGRHGILSVRVIDLSICSYDGLPDIGVTVLNRLLACAPGEKVYKQDFDDGEPIGRGQSFAAIMLKDVLSLAIEYKRPQRRAMWHLSTFQLRSEVKIVDSRFIAEIVDLDVVV